MSSLGSHRGTLGPGPGSWDYGKASRGGTTLHRPVANQTPPPAPRRPQQAAGGQNVERQLCREGPGAPQRLGEAGPLARSIWWDPPAHMEAGDWRRMRCVCIVSQSAVLPRDPCRCPSQGGNE